MRELLEKIECGPRLGTHRRRMIELLRHFSAIDLPQREVADEKHLNRSVSTLKRYCCANSIRFPDYVPRHMKERVS